jgi:hypothetical protein
MEMSPELIVQIKFGSHPCGTNTPTSEVDFKTVYLPTARDILLQWVDPLDYIDKLSRHLLGK